MDNLIFNSIKTINTNRLLFISILLFIIAVILFITLDTTNSVTNKFISLSIVIISYLLIWYKVYFYKNKQIKLKNDFKEFKEDSSILIESFKNSMSQQIVKNENLNNLIKKQKESIYNLELELYDNKHELDSNLKEQYIDKMIKNNKEYIYSKIRNFYKQFNKYTNENNENIPIELIYDLQNISELNKYFGLYGYDKINHRNIIDDKIKESINQSNNDISNKKLQLYINLKIVLIILDNLFKFHYGNFYSDNIEESSLPGLNENINIELKSLKDQLINFS